VNCGNGAGNISQLLHVTGPPYVHAVIDYSDVGDDGVEVRAEWSKPFELGKSTSYTGNNSSILKFHEQPGAMSAVVAM